jgi:hypothetical protein
MTHILNSVGVHSVAKITKVPGTSSPSPGDTTASTVGLTSPAIGDTVSGPSAGVTVAVTETASDESGGSGIQKVEVKVGSNPFKLATATGPGGGAYWSTCRLLMSLQLREILLSLHGLQIKLSRQRTQP